MQKQRHNLSNSPLEMDFCGFTSIKNVVVMTTLTTITFTKNSLKKELVFLSFVEAPIY
jgi:hypothetical protein